MEFLIEFLMELLFDAPFEAAMGSNKIKTSVKTVLFSLLGSVLVLLLGFITYSVYKDGSLWRAAAMIVLTAGMLTLVTWGAVRGHRSKWRS